jgi:hypothetical protein
VRYIGAMHLTRIDIIEGGVIFPRIRGRFTVDTQGGGTGYSPFAGPVAGVALVR